MNSVLPDKLSSRGYEVAVAISRDCFSGKELQKYYTSWFELGEHYLLGRSFWMYETRHPEIEAALYWLKTYPTSPWKTIPWDTKL